MLCISKTYYIAPTTNSKEIPTIQHQDNKETVCPRSLVHFYIATRLKRQDFMDEQLPTEPKKNRQWNKHCKLRTSRIFSIKSCSLSFNLKVNRLRQTHRQANWIIGTATLFTTLFPKYKTHANNNMFPTKGAAEEKLNLVKNPYIIHL